MYHNHSHTFSEKIFFNRLLHRMNKILLLGSLFLICVHGQVVEKCRTDTFPPPEDTKLPTVVVNLNNAPERRWDDAIKPYKEDIVELIQTITGTC